VPARAGELSKANQAKVCSIPNLVNAGRYIQVPLMLPSGTAKIHCAWSAQINYHHCFYSGE
jgi:LSD1 subclass zinc finger protein